MATRADGSITRVSDLRAGDVLLFHQPDFEFSWGYICATPALQKKFTWKGATLGAWLNRLIASLDDCPYTHAAIVLDTGRLDPLLAHADHPGLEQSRLESIRYEYGHKDIAVLRLKEEHAGRRQAIVDRAKALSDGKGRAYPFLSMFAAFCVLAARNRPIQVPMATPEQNGVLNLAVRQAVDTFVVDALNLGLERAVGSPVGSATGRWSRKPKRYEPMCSSFVARVLQDVGLPIVPTARVGAPELLPTPPERSHLDPRTIPRDPQLEGIAGWLASKYQSMHHAAEYWNDGITAAVARDPAFIPELGNLASAKRSKPTRKDWIDYLSQGVPQPPTGSLTMAALFALCDAAASRPVVHAMSSPWDLEHSDLFEELAEIPWP